MIFTSGGGGVDFIIIITIFYETLGESVIQEREKQQNARFSVGGLGWL